MTKSETQFTPGPWLVHDTIDGPLSSTDVRDSQNRWVARCCEAYGRPHVDETEANARLIAAAPELYEALCKLSFAAQTSGGTAGRDEQLVAAIDEAAAALAKARGES